MHKKPRNTAQIYLWDTPDVSILQHKNAGQKKTFALQQLKESVKYSEL
jgi:hypothetical protein